MVKSIIPMASAKIDSDKLAPYWRSQDWVAERKYDGSRYLMYLNMGEEDYPNVFRSRQVSKKTGETVDKTANIPHLSNGIFTYRGTPIKAIFDGEIIVSETASSNEVTSIMGSLPEKARALQLERGYVTYVIFDILELNGADVTKEPWHKRRKLLKGIHKEMFSRFKHIKLSDVVVGDFKEQFYNDIVSQGGEGVILKNVHAPYRAAELGGKEYRNKDTWIKVKKYDTFDVVIMGYTEPTKEYTGKHEETWSYWVSPTGDLISVTNTEGLVATGYRSVTRDYFLGWIGAVKVGQYKDGKLVEMTQMDGMSDDVKQHITDNKDKLIGTVIECGAMEQLKTGALRHPRFLDFRPDKNPEQCLWGVN